MILWSATAAGLAVVVALAHSVISERVILQPLFRQPSQGILDTAPGRDIVRAVFHILRLPGRRLASAYGSTGCKTVPISWR